MGRDGNDYTPLYCVRCGASQRADRVGESCGAMVKGHRCKGTAFSPLIGACNWDNLNDRDATFLANLRIARGEKAEQV